MKDVLKQLYIYEDRDYAEVMRRRNKVEVQGREIPLSETDRPYLMNNEEDDTYQSYEWDMPPYPWPDMPPPDAPPGPCSAEDGCGHVKIMRDYPAKMECGQTFWFRTTHEVHGCQPATGAQAIVAWGASAGELRPRGVGANWTAPECCHEDKVTISVTSPGGCEDAIEIELECECCEDFEIDGPETVNPNNTWTGSIDPPCPGARVFVSSNSECGGSLSGTVNDDGDTITVNIGAAACGSIELTVFDMNEGCLTPHATYSVRINQGSDPIQCVAGWNKIGDYSSPDCPGMDLQPYCPPLCGVCSPGAGWGGGGSCADCTDGRYKYANINHICCCGWDWASGTEWEKGRYLYSINPCGQDQGPPCGCSITALGCAPGWYCGYPVPRATTGEIEFSYDLYEWVGACT